MRHDPVTDGAPASGAPSPRVAAALAGHRRDADAAAALLEDPDAATRSAALGALARCGSLDTATLLGALDDPAPEVRRRACDLAAPPAPPTDQGGNGQPAGAAPATSRHDGTRLDAALARALDDPDPLVVEAACWALGERRANGAVAALTTTAGRHSDPRCREAAVAALGALGDRTGLPAVLAALDDRPAVRRRATVALAAFEGPEVDDALRQSASDRDWQVREVAEILLDPPGGGSD